MNATPSFTIGSAGSPTPSIPVIASRHGVGLVGVGHHLDGVGLRRPGRARRAPSGRRSSRTPWCSCPRWTSPAVSSRNRPRQAISSRPVVTSQTARGRTEMRRPTFDQNPVWVGSGERNAGRLGQKTQRPVITSSAGSSVIITSRVTPTPIAATGPRPRVEFISANSQAQHAEHHRDGAGHDGRRGPVQGERHRLVPVLVAAQLLAVARHQQQGVVGAGTDDEDREDRVALAVDRQVGVLRQQVDQRLRAEQRDAGAEDRQDPQDRAAVGEQQDQDHHAERRAQQRGVDAGERLGGVGRLAAGTRDVHVEPVALGRDLAQLVGDVGHRVPAVGAEVEVDQGLHGLAVLGRHRARATSPSTPSSCANSSACSAAAAMSASVSPPSRS